MRLFVVCFVALWAYGGSPGPALTTLSPGGFRTINQTLDINVVFVGYTSANVNLNTLQEQLPKTYNTIHRYPGFYGIRQPIGLAFQYRYNFVFADSTFQDNFFGHLGSIAASKPRTMFQDLYNAQAGRAATVGDNYWIDAPSVEAWLAANPVGGADTNKYTIYFINWWGRADFKFHVYTKTDEPDPDTGYNFGEIRSSRKMIAWGGMGPRRIWFYDLSAGPDSWTANYDIKTADLDGNGVMDYRMPPIWEYGNSPANTYRPFNDLSGDLGKVARFVAIDLLFTASPLYKPAISPPKLPTRVQVDMNIYQGVPGTNGRTLLTPALIPAKLGPLQPLNQFSLEVKDVAFSGRAADVYLCFLSGVSCFGNRIPSNGFADPFIYHDTHLMQFLEGDADYEVPVFTYFTPDALNAGGLLGYADDNWRDGTQSFVFTFLSPGFTTLGYGLTSTVIHETGHHLGMSHPHDGYDSELNLDFGAGDQLYFAWAGDYSNTVMHYLDVALDFGQFDRDNMSRYLTATFINQANSILAAVMKSPRAGEASAELLAADASASSALTRYAAMDYTNAAAQASSAYGKVLEAAAKINVHVEPQSWQADYKSKGKSPKFVDTVDYHRSLP
jgi:hypothetical protein